MLNDRLRLRVVLSCCKKWLYVKFRSLYGGKPESFINRPSRFEQADPAPTASLTFASSVIYAARKILCAQQWRYAICHRSRVFRSPISVSLWIRGWKKPQSKKSDATRVIVGSVTFHMEKLANAWRAVDLVCITSKMEGSSNVLSEALASRVPVVASRISGLMGTLGNRFPGYFPVGDTERLKALLLKAESQPKFYRDLTRYCARLSDRVKPKREIEAWRRLLAQFA